MLRRVLAGSAEANFRPQRDDLRLKRALLKSESGPSKVKLAKNDNFSFLGRGPTRPGDPSTVNFTPAARALAASLQVRYACINNDH